jgi:hypothetical protein
LNFFIFNFNVLHISRFFLFRHLLSMGLVGLCLTGCQSLTGLNSSMIEEFVPQEASQRVMLSPRIFWEVRTDVAQYCAKLTGVSPGTALFLTPMGCAIWDIRRQECTVVTGTSTTHAILGHEIRHCFEGRFH